MTWPSRASTGALASRPLPHGDKDGLSETNVFFAAHASFASGVAGSSAPMRLCAGSPSGLFAPTGDASSTTCIVSPITMPVDTCTIELSALSSA